ncbi:MAG: hypothetical protein ABFC24_03355 [Methanoregulaceae archaeon]
MLNRFTGWKKAAIIACCVMLVIAGVSFAIGYTVQADQRKHLIQLHLTEVASRIAGGINGDGLLSIKPGDEGSPVYLSFARPLYDARRNESNIVNAFILRVDDGNISYVVHDAYVVRGLDPYVVRTGYPVTEDKEIIRAAFAGPTTSPDVYTSRWGSFLSGYAPVKDSNGTVVGILGIDETADTVYQYEYSGLFSLVEVV